MTEPRIFVSTYNKYNRGSLRGQWIQLEGHDEDSFYEACKMIHSDERDPEFMFPDFEGFPKEFYSESYLSKDLWKWLETEGYDRKLFSHYKAAGYNGSIEDARDAFAGSFNSIEEFIENLLDEFGEKIPDWISINCKSTWNNLSDDYKAVIDEDGTHWFFLNR